MADFLNFDLPQLGGDDTKKQLKKISQYLQSMTDQLRFTLANLDPEENFNSQALAQWNSAVGGSSGGGGSGGGGGGGSSGKGVETLFARFGTVADVTVWKMQTDTEKIDRYLSGDTSAIRYLTISGGKIRFILAETDGSETEQLHDGDTLYWYKNANSREIGTENTGFPVTLYKYAETEKGFIGWDGNALTLSGITVSTGGSTT